MSVPPIVDMPDTCASSIVMSLQHVVGSTTSPYTLESQYYKWQGEKWFIDFNLPSMTKKEVAAQWQAFGLKMQGEWGVFLAGDPLSKNPRGTNLGSPVVNGNFQTGNVLQTRGWSPNQVEALSVGDYIQVGTGLSAKLHFVTDIVQVNSSGLANINIAPSLRYAPNDGQEIITINPRGAFKLVGNTWSWSVSPGPLYRISFSAQEYLS